MVWIILPKIVWNEISKNGITFLVISHLKLIICQKFNLPYTYGHCLKKHQFVIWWLSNSSHGSQIYSNHMESQCLIDITNFIKIKNHFNHFLRIFTFFSALWHIYIAKIYFNITLYEIKKCNFFCIWLRWVLTYHNMQKIMKILHNNGMVEI